MLAFQASQGCYPVKLSLTCACVFHFALELGSQAVVGAARELNLGPL